MRKDKGITLSTKKEAEVKQRAALHTLLSTDEEYTELADYIDVNEDTYVALGIELDKLFDSRGLLTPATVTRILQYDVQGYNPTLIAKLMRLKPEQVRMVKSSDAYKIAKDELLNSVVTGARKYMEVATLKAVKTLMQCLDSGNERVRLAASQDLLNRAGLQAPTQIEITTQTTNFEHMSDEELAEILKKDRAIPGNAEVVHLGPATTNKG